jgi:hypothetical protein
LPLTVVQNRLKVVAASRTRIGCLYEWDGKGPTRFDCSGLLEWSYIDAIGLAIGAGTAGMLANPNLRWVLNPGTWTAADAQAAGATSADAVFTYQGEHVLMVTDAWPNTIEAPNVGLTVREDRVGSTTPPWAGTPGFPIYAIARYLYDPTPPPPPPFPGVYLRLATPEMTGAEVAQWQQQLNAAHGAALKIDSTYGPITATATRLFQAGAGLTQDGIVGPATWAAGFKPT